MPGRPGRPGQIDSIDRSERPDRADREPLQVGVFVSERHRGESTTNRRNKTTLGIGEQLWAPELAQTPEVVRQAPILQLDKHPCKLGLLGTEACPACRWCTNLQRKSMVQVPGLGTRTGCPGRVPGMAGTRTRYRTGYLV